MYLCIRVFPKDNTVFFCHQPDKQRKTNMTIMIIYYKNTTNEQKVYHFGSVATILF